MDSQNTRNIPNLMGMAGTAERAGNFEEAVSYYNRALEADPQNSAAWLGKGRAAGWLSTRARLRVSETIVAFGHAIATATDSDKQVVADRAATDAASIISAAYALIKPQGNGRQASADREHYVRTGATLTDDLAEVLRWSPTSPAALDLIVFIATDLLNTGVPPDLAAVLTARRNQAIMAITASRPAYSPPPVADRTAGKDLDADTTGYIVVGLVVILVACIAFIAM